MAGKVFERVRGLLLWAAVLLAAASPWLLLHAQDPSPLNNSTGPMQGLQSFSSPGFSLDTTTPTQQGLITSIAGNTATATVTSFDTSRTILLVTGCDTLNVEGAAGQNANTNRALLTITNATTITATWGGGPGAGNVHCGFGLIQFGTGVVNSLQTCSITLTSLTTATCAITTVNTARAVAIYQGEALGGVNPVTSDIAEARVDLADATHCRATRATLTAAADSVGCMVVEFK